MLDGNLTRANCVDFRTGGKRANKGFSYLYLINVVRVTINLISAMEISKTETAKRRLLRFLLFHLIEFRWSFIAFKITVRLIACRVFLLVDNVNISRTMALLFRVWKLLGLLTETEYVQEG